MSRASVLLVVVVTGCLTPRPASPGNEVDESNAEPRVSRCGGAMASPVPDVGAPNPTPANFRRGALEYPQVTEERCPTFPASALGGRGEAVVTMRVAIDGTGVVREVVVVRSAGSPFDAIATSTLTGFRFTPARLDGRPVPVKITYRFVFQR